MSIKADIDYKGFLFNVLTSVGLSVDSNALCELIDNSIDANATNIKINITSDKEKISINENGKLVVIKGPFLIVSDNGMGLNNDRIKKLLTLCTENKNNNHNGKFGIGAIGSFSNINKHLYKNNKDSYTLLLSKTEDSLNHQEIILNFTYFYNTEDPSFWQNVSGQNISPQNKDIFDKYKIHEDGTVIINTIDTISINNFIEKLKYKCILHYYNYIKDNLQIQFINRELNWTLNKDSELVDLTGEDRNNNMFKFKIYTNNTTDFYAKFVSSDLKESDKKIHFNNFKYIKLTPRNKKQHYNKFFEFTNKIPEDVKEKYMVFKIIITEPYIKQDSIKKILFDNTNLSFQGDDYNGLYVERNYRILAKPFAVENIRQTQNGVRLRAKIEYNSDDFDNLFPVQIDKSQFNGKHMNKGLYRLVSLLSQEIYIKHYLGENDKFKKELFDRKNVTLNINQKKTVQLLVPPKPVNTNTRPPKLNDTRPPKLDDTILPKLDDTILPKLDDTILPKPVDKIPPKPVDKIPPKPVDKIPPKPVDHIDDNNNDDSNCQVLTLLSHYLKTYPKDKIEKIKNNENERKKFLIEHINILLQSSLLQNNIYFENNQIYMKNDI